MNERGRERELFSVLIDSFGGLEEVEFKIVEIKSGLLMGMCDSRGDCAHVAKQILSSEWAIFNRPFPHYSREYVEITE